MGYIIILILQFSQFYPGPPGPGPNIGWTKSWGGNDDDILYKMVVDSSGDILLAGETLSYGNGGSDLFLVKMNENITQYNTWGGTEPEEFGGMVIDSNDNIYIAGSTSSYGAGENDVVLLKYNHSFELEWNTTWGELETDTSSNLAVDSSNNIYIAGITDYPYYDIFLVKYNSSGDLQWNETWSTGTNNITEKVLSLVIDSSDHIFLGVNTNKTGSEWSLLKYNSSGTLVLNKSYNRYLPFKLVVLDSLDNLYATGSYDDMFLAKFDNDGNLVWNITCIQKILPGTEVLNIDSSDNIFIAGNGLINASAILYGYNITDYDTYLMKFSDIGILQWNRTLIHTVNGNNMFPEILSFDSLGYIYLGGSLEIISTKDLDLFISVFEQSGYPIRDEGGGWDGNAYCKGIYAESINNFIVAENTPRFEGWDYEVILTKYIEPQHYYPVIFDLYFILNIIFSGLFLTFSIIGISLLIKRRRARLSPFIS